MNALHRLARPRVLWTLLIVSVATNLFLGGMLSGRYGARALYPLLLERDVEGHLGFASHARRAELRRSLLPPEAEMRAYRQEMHALRRALAEELAQESPSRERLESGLAELRTHNMMMQERLHRRFIDTALALPVAERRALMDAMLRPAYRRGARHAASGTARHRSVAAATPGQREWTVPAD